MAKDKKNAPAKNDTRESQEEIQMVTFYLGNERFGVEILMVQEIIIVPEITRIPNAPKFVQGVINLRGRLVPVIDLRKRLGVGETQFEQKTRIVVVQIKGKVTGLIVDAVEAVLQVPTDSIEEAPEIVTIGVETRYITGVSKHQARMIILLDFDKLLSKDEIEKLQKVGQEETTES